MTERFYCKKCNTEIDGHNQFLHDGMCDDCFSEVYFPEDQKKYMRRVIMSADEKKFDPIGKKEEDFEKALGFTQYVETKEVKDNKLYVDAFFLFVDKLRLDKLKTYRLYDGEITAVLDWGLGKIKENLHLEYQRKGLFYDDDVYVSQAFSDNKTFYAIVQEGIIFFSGNDEATNIMKECLDELNIKYFEHALKDL